jgi:hypothetical protein
MKKFIFKSIVLIIPILIVILVVENQLSKVKNSMNYKKNSLRKKSSEINTIILGSSQSYYGINPSFFSTKTFNLANSSQSIYYDKEILLKEIEGLTSLKNVIIPISYFSLFYKLEDGKEAWRINYYKKFWDIKSVDYNFFDVKNYSLLALYSPEKSINYIQKGVSKIDLSEGVDETGFLKRDSAGLSNRISNNLGRERIKYHTSLINEQNLSSILNSIDEMATMLIKKKINIYFLSLPIYKTYSDYLDNKIVAKNDSIINTLCKKYYCTYNNYSLDTRFVKEDFYDNDHLNVFGANKFSKILDSIIQSKK